jgi:tRNA A-37 threonylcarbamoyl transferase component Bud32
MTSPDILTRSLLPPTAADTRRRCRVACDRAGGSHFRSEIGALLFRRLRIVVLIALAPTALFFVRALLEGHHQLPVGRLDLTLQAGVTALLAGLASLLWRRSDWSLSALHKMEVAVFGLLAFFFSWLQWRAFLFNPLFVQRHGTQIEVARLWINTTALRWFFLIVIYGVFIPNSWRRCAVISGLAALTPLVLTFFGALTYGHLNTEVVLGLLDLTILMLTAFAVGVFGSYRFSVLQQQAFQAQQLGQYRLEKQIGAGGMGEVYLAEHVLLRRPCAIKLIRPEQMLDPAVRARFEREVQAMATLTHWNTVEVFDYGHADDGTFYYVMEYLPGLNLEKLVEQYGRLPPERTIHLLRQVCCALREAHGIGLLHRDIKPSNIIVCRRGGIDDVVKLLDFGLVHGAGLSTDDTRLTVQGTVLGSPPFMAPEQAAGRPDLDPRADIYSLGGVGYYLLTGQQPFVKDTAMEMLMAHAYEPVKPPRDLRPDVPDDLQTVILSCLSKKPEDRPQSADELEKALAACAGSNPWSDKQAREWWESVRAEDDTTPTEMPTVKTPQGV